VSVLRVEAVRNPSAKRSIVYSITARYQGQQRQGLRPQRSKGWKHEQQVSLDDPRIGIAQTGPQPGQQPCTPRHDRWWPSAGPTWCTSATATAAGTTLRAMGQGPAVGTDPGAGRACRPRSCGRPARRPGHRRDGRAGSGHRTCWRRTPHAGCAKLRGSVMPQVGHPHCAASPPESESMEASSCSRRSSPGSFAS
jgi:hypothetical protein